MEAHELRIGNLVYKSLKSGNGRKLENRIGCQDIVRIEENIGSFNYEPIEITEEWLLKLFFEKEENPFWFGNNVISISPSTGTYVLYGKSGREITRTGLKYIHQLQNLHFALTQRELNVV